MKPHSKKDQEAAAAFARLTAGQRYSRREACLSVRSCYGSLPDQALLEHEIRRWYALFDPCGHTRTLTEKRESALSLMTLLESKHPFLTGPVLSGAALPDDLPEVFLHGNSKEMALFLLSEGITYEVVNKKDCALQKTVTFLLTPKRGKTNLLLHITDGFPHFHPIRPDDYQHPLEAQGKLDQIGLQRLIRETKRQD